jgi:hypothetical protein
MHRLRNSRVVLGNTEFSLGENYLGESSNYAYFCHQCGAIWGRLESGADITPTNRFILKNELCSAHGGGSFLPQLDWGNYTSPPSRRKTLESLPVGLLLHEANIVINQILKGKS